MSAARWSPAPSSASGSTNANKLLRPDRRSEPRVVLRAGRIYVAALRPLGVLCMSVAVSDVHNLAMARIAVRQRQGSVPLSNDPSDLVAIVVARRLVLRWPAIDREDRVGWHLDRARGGAGRSHKGAGLIPNVVDRVVVRPG